MINCIYHSIWSRSRSCGELTTRGIGLCGAPTQSGQLSDLTRNLSEQVEGDVMAATQPNRNRSSDPAIGSSHHRRDQPGWNKSLRCLFNPTGGWRWALCGLQLVGPELAFDRT